MQHVKAIAIKFVMILAVLTFIHTIIFDGSFTSTLIISIVLTLAAYLLGDLVIFRKAGNDANRNNDQYKRNIIGTGSDLVVAFLIIWLLGDLLFKDDINIVGAAVISTLIIGFGEWVFHIYLDKNVFPEKSEHY
ncbi:DUF2512 family protein [Lysinibacillus odysseyi]|uniref:DUF2512 domain-containing protein n=1 Tax=Lysinibacillus odysseyi 34hs-1 = NBRC 100172 TaxID=1220589 RepID=A0A0A3IEE8_9BACI|nr:DUF2512 family protein [Lysinibacillus odysseyi]KGR81800.1 hypothetical protein CD32_20955 [Lysinibacillus odysseyi 34hs-1 = NBRC 100172]